MALTMHLISPEGVTRLFCAAYLAGTACNPVVVQHHFMRRVLGTMKFSHSKAADHA